MCGGNGGGSGIGRRGRVQKVEWPAVQVFRGFFDLTLFVKLGWVFFWFVLFAEDVRSAPVLGMGWVYVLVCDFGCE